jgi:hypothetical protein
MSGASLLVSRLKTDAPVWVSHETVKLSDSISSNLQDPPVDIRSQIEFLISQTNAQERSLLRYHAELSKRIEESDELKCAIILKNRSKTKYRAFLQWRSMVRRASNHMVDSVSLNDNTLRNLALSLNSPLRPVQDLDISTSTIKSVTAMPFQTARFRHNNSFSLNTSRKM